MQKLITPELIYFDLKAGAKEDVIRLLAEKMDAAGRLHDRELYIADVLKREETYSTAVGFQVAIPHAKTGAARTATIAFARLEGEIPWDDEEPVRIIFQLAVPTTDKGDRHLQILASLSRKLIHADFREKLAAAVTPEEIIKLIEEV